MSKIQAWFREHNSFEGGPEVRSLSTGICNDGKVNCDNSEKFGKEIQEQLENVYFHDEMIKQRLKVRNIESLYNSVKISDKKFVIVKPPALFLQLIAIAQRENNIERFFSYKVATFPTSLFKDVLTRKPKKAILRNTLLTKKVDIDPNSLCVLDGGALFCTKYDGLGASFLETFARFMLIASQQNMASAQLYLTGTAIHHLSQIMSTQEEVSIRGTV